MTARLAMVLPAMTSLANRIVSVKLPRLVASGWDAHVIAPTLPANIDPLHRSRIHIGSPERELAVLRPDLVHLEVSTTGHRPFGTHPCVVTTFGGRDLVEAPQPWPGVRGVHCHTVAERTQAVAQGQRTDTVVIPPVIAPPSTRSYDPHDGPLRVLAVAPLHWTQGLEFALEAMYLLRRMHVVATLRIVGAGDAMVPVAFARYQFALEGCVELIQGTSDPAAQFAWADVFLHVPVVDAVSPDLLEAQMFGLPAVTSDATGLAALVSSGETALVVPRRAPRATADALALLARDRDLRVRLGEGARRHAGVCYAPNSTAEAYGGWYHQILGA